MPTQQEFLNTLDLYLAKMGEDSCFEQARQFFASRPAFHELWLDHWGSPAEQLRTDAQTLSQMKPTAFNWQVYLIGLSLSVYEVWLATASKEQR